MEILPAIDLRGGQVVRLFQGDYDQMTVYGQEDVYKRQTMSITMKMGNAATMTMSTTITTMGSAAAAIIMIMTPTRCSPAGAERR